MYFEKPLHEIQDLKDHLNNPLIQFLDCSMDKVDKPLPKSGIQYLPSAIFFDIEGSFSDHQSKLPHSLPSPGDFEKEMQNLGINQDTILVLYDRWGVYSSPRAWWMLKTMGAKEVYIINGGLPEWLKQKMPTQKSLKENVAKGNFKVDFKSEWFADKNYVLKHYKNTDINIVDARSKGRFSGLVSEPRKGLISGHIPHSINLPFQDVLEETKFKSKEDLKDIFKSHKITQHEQVFTCGSGVTASILAFANYYIGNSNTRVYDGSWAEWGIEEFNLPVMR